MWNLKYKNELIYKPETDSQTQKTNLWLPKAIGGQGGKDRAGAWHWMIRTVTSETVAARLYCAAQGTIASILCASQSLS